MRAAVIGCGRMGAQPSARLEGSIPAGWLPLTHAEALLAVDGVELAALCDVSEAVVKRHAAHYGVAGAYTDYRELLDEVRPEILSIATRTPAKAGIVEHACRAGVKGLYIEKPLANSLGECMRLLGLMAENGVKIAYGVNRRYHPVYRSAREMLAAGEIGEVIEIVVEHGLAPLLWSHPHSTDLILFLSGAGELDSVQACCTAESVARAGELIVDSDPRIESAFFRMSDGVTGHIVRSRGLSVRVGGTAGTLTVHADGSYIQINGPHAPGDGYFLHERVVHPLGKRGATVTAMMELACAVREGTASPTPENDIIAGTRMLMGCTWSHLNHGRIVTAAEIPARLTVTGRSGDLYA
jgi:scyllo-inositol 2-dehydrogenase (NAD+)